MKEICAFGDSILKGVILDSVGKYKILKSSFSNLCSSMLNCSIMNWGLFGSTIDKGEQILDRHFDQLQKYDYAVLEFGGNDCDFNWQAISEEPEKEYIPNTCIDKFEAMYLDAIHKIKSVGIKPVLLSLPPISATKYFDAISRNRNGANILKWLKGDVHFISNWHESYNISVFKVAAAAGAQVIDITSAFLRTPNYNNLLCADGIHPNEDGHKIIAQRIKEYVEERFSSISLWQKKDSE